VLLDTGEELLEAALGANSTLTKRAQAIDPFIVPYDQLARVDGWIVWLGHPPVPDGITLLPVPGYLMWDEPETALAATAAVAADYAARRGARSADGMMAVIERESPVAVVVPGQITAGLQGLLDEFPKLRVPVLDRPRELQSALASLGSFALRRRAHGAAIPRAHDPALSFQHLIVDGRIGGDARSTYVVHNEGQRDGLEVTGSFGERVGIEIGVRGPAITAESTAALERPIAEIPAFLSGVTSAMVGQSLEIGWRFEAEPTAEEIGEAFRVWVKALFGAEVVDVRIAFAPPGERSDRLLEMRTRAEEFRRRRESGRA
jgi:hypothetical protein